MAEHFGSLALPVGEFLALEHGTGGWVGGASVGSGHASAVRLPVMRILELLPPANPAGWPACLSRRFSALAAEYAGYAIPSSGSSPTASTAAEELKRIEVCKGLGCVRGWGRGGACMCCVCGLFPPHPCCL